MRQAFVLSVLFGACLSSWANASLGVGDRIRFTDQVGSTGGGEFGVHKKNDPNPFGGTGQSTELFRTFCLEKNEFIDFDHRGFIITSITQDAARGGNGGGNPDPIDPATAWLFYNFTIGTLDTLVPGYSYNDTDSANALQNAIWYRENEITSLPTGLATTLYNISGAADATVAAANTFVLNIVWSTDRHGFQGLYDNVMGPPQTNATPAQSMLYVIPEASTVAVWSILSILGLGVAYRKKLV